MATTQAGIVDAIANLPSLAAITGTPTLPETLPEALPPLEAAAMTSRDIDARVEPKWLENCKLPLPSEIVKGELSKIERILQYVSRKLQSLGSSKKGKTPEIKKYKQ